jgi:lysine-N-methylase
MVLEAYAEGDKRYYRPLMARHPHLGENYLINYVFKNSYPFGRQSRQAVPDSTKGSDAESEYLLLCAHATLAETQLIGMAAHHHEAFDLVHVVKLVQSLAKAIEHSKTVSRPDHPLCASAESEQSSRHRPLAQTGLDHSSASAEA